jgi:para-nitrobenzyl esterase
MASDLSFVHESRYIARTHAAAGQKAYRYQFSRGNKLAFLQGLRAHHGAELPFLFQRPAGRDEKEMRLSRTLGRYWIKFAGTGDPNGVGLPPWPVYRQDADAMIDFAEEVRALQGDRNGQLDVIAKVLRVTEEPAAKKAE